MARLHRLGRAYSHEGVIESSLGDIEIYYPDDDGKFPLDRIWIVLKRRVTTFFDFRFTLL